jgi:hypothetical protein
MKSIFILILCPVFFACSKEANSNASAISDYVTIQKDCTGGYIRWHKKDYKVCNLDILDPFQNEESVYAKFTIISACNGSGNVASSCYMLHPFEGWIEVVSIR